MEFDDVINEHLELQRRNARLEQSLPLERYRTQPTARNDSPPKRQAEAVPEQTEDFSPGWLTQSEPARNNDADSSQLWDVPPLFDWGD
jgi:hypothetical protein